jgi:hypothetical protein
VSESRVALFIGASQNVESDGWDVGVRPIEQIQGVGSVPRWAVQRLQGRSESGANEPATSESAARSFWAKHPLQLKDKLCVCVSGPLVERNSWSCWSSHGVVPAMTVPALLAAILRLQFPTLPHSAARGIASPISHFHRVPSPPRPTEELSTWWGAYRRSQTTSFVRQ